MIHSDEPIPDAARAYIEALPAGDWYLFDMSPLDRTGVPAWEAALFPHDCDAAACEMQQGTGYGGHGVGVLPDGHGRGDPAAERVLGRTRVLPGLFHGVRGQFVRVQQHQADAHQHAEPVVQPQMLGATPARGSPRPGFGQEPLVQQPRNQRVGLAA